MFRSKSRVLSNQSSAGGAAPPVQFAHCVIGGGIVGLALAAKLGQHAPTILLERRSRFITETSARNSGVLHAGIYYPLDSLKTKLCVEGNKIIRNLMNVDNMRKQNHQLVDGLLCTKWIGCNSSSPNFEAQFEKILQLEENMTAIGPELTPFRRVPEDEIRSLEPGLSMDVVIESMHTGIIDVHSLADFYLSRMESPYCEECTAVTDTTVKSIKRKYNGVANSPFIVQTAGDENGDSSPTSSIFEFEADVVINAAGHEAMSIHRDFAASLVGEEGFLGKEEKVSLLDSISPPFTVHPCKGRYVKYTGPRYKIPTRLIYPVPLAGLKGLGVHSTIDLGQNLKFGPDAIYVTDPYDVSVEPYDDEFLDMMHNEIVQYLPGIKRSELVVDYAGVRPKLSAEGEGFKDFYIKRLDLSQVSSNSADDMMMGERSLPSGDGEENGEKKKKKNETEALQTVGDESAERPESRHLALSNQYRPSFLAQREMLRKTTKEANFGTFVTLAGIESPGLTASPAIADYVSEELLGYRKTKWI